MASGDSVSAALERLLAHLDDVEQNPSHPLDTDLFETLQPFISSSSVIDLATTQALIPQLARLLPQLQQDPTLVIELLIRMIEPLDFDSIRSLQPPVDFAAGLDLAAVPFHTLALSLLEKAEFSSRHAEFIASTPDIVSRLIQLWLATEDLGIAYEAGHILLKLLQVDKDPADVLGIDSAPDANSRGHGEPTATVPSPEASASYGTGFMWKRVFGDKDIYSLFFALCGAEGPRSQVPPPSRSRKTVAQARLMAWLPEVGAMSWSAISHSHHPDVEKSFGLKSVGLLDFISIYAVDYDGDVLMHNSLMDFFSDLLKACNQPSKSTSSHHGSIAVEYLKSTGLHERTLNYFLDPSSHASFEISYLYRPAANYLSTYASTYPSDFEANGGICNQVLRRIMDVLGNMKPTQWAHGESPIHDLHVIASLPRSTLLPESESIWASTPLALVPINRHTNADALRTLATVFHGPESPEITFPPTTATLNSSATSPARLEAERGAARTLYYLYTTNNSNFATEIVQSAETIALKETALAALDFVTAIATANWSTSSPASAAITVPSDFPATGLACILRPGNPILPCLLRPAPRFMNLVGGRGEAETTAYQVQSRKFDALKTLMWRLEECADDAVPGRGSFLDMMRERVAQGLWGRDGDVGGRIATLEM